MNTGDWRAFNATDQHTSDVLLAQSDTGRKVQRESTHEGKTAREDGQSHKHLISDQ